MRALLLPGSRINEIAFRKDATHQIVAKAKPHERRPDLFVLVVGMTAADARGGRRTDECVQTKHNRHPAGAAKATVEVELHSVGVGRRVQRHAYGRVTHAHLKGS